MTEGFGCFLAIAAAVGVACWLGSRLIRTEPSPHAKPREDEPLPPLKLGPPTAASASRPRKPEAKRVSEKKKPSTALFRLEVTGESHFVQNFERICGPRCEDGEDREVDAQLVPDDTNPYDRNAVQVQVQGLQVGWLGKQDAKVFRTRAAADGWQLPVSCRGRITGGWEREEEEPGHYGIRLDFPLHG